MEESLFSQDGDGDKISMYNAVSKENLLQNMVTSDNMDNFIESALISSPASNNQRLVDADMYIAAPDVYLT